MFNSLGDEEIAIDWIKFGKERKKDDNSVFRFMAYWMALNFLYKSEKIQNLTRSNHVNGYINEKEYLKTYIKDSFENDKQIYEDILRLDSIKVFEKDAVLEAEDVNNGEQDFLNIPLSSIKNKKVRDCVQTYQDFMNNTGKEKIENLFCIIYKVRCNLFHGGKRINNKRDMELVEAGANILEKYFEKKYNI